MGQCNTFCFCLFCFFCRALSERLLLFGSQASPKYKALYRYNPHHVETVSIHERQTEMTLVSYLSMSRYKSSATIRMSATVIPPGPSTCLHGDTVKSSCPQKIVDLRVGKATLYYRGWGCLGGAGLGGSSQVH